MTGAERVLWRALRSALPQYHWRKQVPFGPYTVDFCSHSAKLIIEVDGGQHATEGARDEGRTRVLQSEGYRVLRFWNNDVLSNIDVVHRIAEEISTSPSHSFAAGPALSHGRGKLVPCQ